MILNKRAVALNLKAACKCIGYNNRFNHLKICAQLVLYVIKKSDVVNVV